MVPELLTRELKHEVRWETFGVPFDLLVQALGGHAVDLGEIGIDTERGSAEMVMPSGMAPKRSEGAHERVPLGQRMSDHLLSANGLSAVGLAKADVDDAINRDGGRILRGTVLHGVAAREGNDAASSPGVKSGVGFRNLVSQESRRDVLDRPSWIGPWPSRRSDTNHSPLA